MTRTGHARFWSRVKGGSVTQEELRRFFRGHRATVDWSACEFYRELMAAYPHAKVLLNLRDADAWCASTKATLYAVQDAVPWWFPRSVLRTVPPERLLEYRVEQGWKPLCEFLGRPAPEGVAFPRINDRKYFERVLLGLRIAEWAMPLAVLRVLAATVMY